MNRAAPHTTIASTDGGPAISARDLVKRYGDLEAVRGISFDVAPGEVVGFLGPNGAGKTTTVRMISCFLPPTSGTARVFGVDVRERPRDVKRMLGICPQEDNLDPDFDVLKNLLVYGRYFGMPSAEVKRRALPLLETMALQEKAKSPVAALSGGMKRRLILARALLNEPRVLVLDEPTTGLDPQARHLIWERMRSLTAQGKTLVLTTHHMEEAERLCRRLAIMDHGRIIAAGSPRALIAEHIEPHVVEVHGPGAEEWMARAKALAARVERVGDTVFCYAENGEPLLKSLEGQSELVYLHRPASLEDVFLKLTGRDLRD